MLNNDTVFTFLFVEIVYLAAIGFLSGWVLVLDAEPKAGKKLLYGVSLLFAGIMTAMAIGAPAFPLTVFRLKPYFILIMGIALGFFYNRYKDKLAKQQRGVQMVIMTYLLAILLLTLIYLLLFGLAVLTNHFLI